jgi:hypothetical protein
MKLSSCGRPAGNYRLGREYLLLLRIAATAKAATSLPR